MHTGQHDSIAAVGMRLRPAELAARVAACLIAIFGVTVIPATACATTIPVGRCGDVAGKGGYILRIAVNHAGDGDTVDFSSLPSTCSMFTLLAGEISIPVTNLTIQTPLDHVVTVDGASAPHTYISLTDGNPRWQILYDIATAYG